MPIAIGEQHPYKPVSNSNGGYNQVKNDTFTIRYPDFPPKDVSESD